MSNADREQKLNKELTEWAGLEDVLELGRICTFTQSFDACIEWLVPKIKGYTLQSCDDGHLAYVFTETSKEFGIDRRPALAMCLAIEKLIDGEHNEQS